MMIISKLIGAFLMLISAYMIWSELTETEEEANRLVYWDGLKIRIISGGVFGLISGGILVFSNITICDYIDAI